MDLRAIRFASHALKGAAEACFVAEMAEACYDLEHFSWEAAQPTVSPGAVGAAPDAARAVALVRRACAASRRLVPGRAHGNAGPRGRRVAGR